jgi:hypothetical protein
MNDCGINDDIIVQVHGKKWWLRCYLHSTTKYQRQSVGLVWVPGRCPDDILPHGRLHQRLAIPPATPYTELIRCTQAGKQPTSHVTTPLMRLASYCTLCKIILGTTRKYLILWTSERCRDVV